tara:strand:+ start:678 stop:923 length:246 start_codon:yes stop_codon:yes gene_type:complete
MGKYDPWREHLLRADADQVKMSFAELEALAPLPPSARKHAAWWSNEDADSTTHSQCKAWISAGYRARPDLASGEVKFIRAK